MGTGVGVALGVGEGVGVGVALAVGEEGGVGETKASAGPMVITTWKLVSLRRSLISG